MENHARACFFKADDTGMCVEDPRYPLTDIQPTLNPERLTYFVVTSFLESFYLSKPHGTASTTKRSEVVRTNCARNCKLSERLGQ